MSTRNAFMLLCLITSAPGSAAAQDVFHAGVPAQRVPTVFGGPAVAAGIGLIAVEPFDGAKPVVDAPYTAEAITETTQTLADGNRIAHQTSATIARDRRGRVRREHQAVLLGPLLAQRPVPLVTISDPSTGTHLTLDQERRVVTRARTRAPAASPRGDLSVAFEPAYAARASVLGIAGSDEIRTESLGSRIVEGVRAEGTRTTMTIPAGRVGNQLPIDVVSESWYSPELQIVVETRRSDPRSGETVYRLTNIIRDDPPANLFDIPEGFRPEDQRAPRGLRP